ncbi:phage tail protein [Glaciecola sp. MF2-115]|uniref:phage tail protein n=1 Tax=Glaciecola sp. MF2-115 TaxID=3384827 RepID=UPI0039A3A287
MKLPLKSTLVASLLITLSGLSTKVIALDTPLIGEVRFVAFNFAPRGWAKCDGQLLPIAQNNALFSILGTTYGGDGRTTFGLPDMRGRTPVHEGSSPGLLNYSLGQKSGQENATLNASHVPQHSHDLTASTSSARTSSASGNVLARTRSNLKVYDSSASNVTLDSETVSTSGTSSVINMQPSLTLNCIIALTGIYPSRN